ncbi:putative lipoprotein [Myxococcus stipitatus DSM 14675]|uniref:Putative lipoprotein n=1 Tax=Myxococcus stipitatus (strain DSM 14675 / JCM 12634 / Mx s8) TaxID=1278073 RepID=L7U7B6_MYXSD|nr:lipoprotein [Myxococcus stipitatus]AGC43437.1 putative lipoprotein [Myxococcus stipitatus DSM 14675]
MRATGGYALLCLGLMGCGTLAEDFEPPLRGEAMASASTSLECPPGVARRVRVVVPPGTPESPTFPVGPESLTDVGGALFFTVNFRDGRGELWRSDGSEEGTQVVRAFPVSAPLWGPGLTELVAVGNRVFFQAAPTETGNELWVSDGTGAGTRMVKDLMPGPGNSRLSHLTHVGPVLTFFRTVTEPTPTGLELWASNGTEAGTVRLASFGPVAALGAPVLKVGNALLFSLSEPRGTFLWRTDGTAAGTVLVKRLDAGEVRIGEVGSAGAGGLGLFTLLDTVGTEVWRTDGTAAGTVRLETFGRAMRLLGAMGTSVILAEEDDVGQRLHLRRVSLTGGGKAFITSLDNPYAGQPDAYPYLQHIVPTQEWLFFSLAIGSPGPSPRRVRLWVTDGTAAGTRQLPGELSTSDEYWSPVAATGPGSVFFAGAQPSRGVEPWVSHGSAATTWQVADANPTSGSSPGGFTRMGARIFFGARDDTGRLQLWAVPADAVCPPG